MNRQTRFIAALLAVLAFAACSGSDAQPPTSIPLIVAPATAQTHVAPTPVIPARTPAELGLSGRLLYVQGQAGVFLFDLSSGKIAPVFQPPRDGLVGGASLSPDGKLVVMSYSPPPDPSKPQLGYTRLFIMPADGSAQPQPLLQPTDETGLLYTLPGWSPDGKSVVFGYFSPQDGGDSSTGFSIQQVTYPDGHPKKLVDNGFQPRLSPDGAQLVYVGLNDPTTPINQLYLAGADGSNPHKLVPLDNSLWTIDAPGFSRDGKHIIFSGVTSKPRASTGWLDELFGVRVASAHSIPSDLWEVSTSGGEPVNLSYLGDTGLYPDMSPDGKHIAYLSVNGIFVMDPDGSHLAQISVLGGAGTLQWVP